MNALLKQLTEVNGVSGDEKAVRLLLRDLIKDHVDDYWADAVGNLIALKKGTGESDLRVMVDAHGRNRTGRQIGRFRRHTGI